MALKLVEQGAMFLETEVKDGISKKICYVVQKTPFIIKLQVENFSVNFLDGKLEMILCYDTPEQKQVEMPSGPPLSYTIHPSTDTDGQTCSIETRLKALTSKYHQMLFILRIKLIDTKQEKSIEVKSMPIRCVSKPEQIRKKMAEHEGTPLLHASKKRPRSDELIEILQSISQTQSHHTTLLRQLVDQRKENVQPDQPYLLRSSKPAQVKIEELSLEDVFELLLKRWNDEPAVSRTSKIRKISHQSPAFQDLFEEISTVYSSHSQTSDDEPTSFSGLNDEELVPSILRSPQQSDLQSVPVLNQDFNNWISETFLK